MTSSSSITFSTGWNGKLEYKPGFKEMEETILQFNRNDIFDHGTEVFKNSYSAHILFRNEYGDNSKQPKRVPNSFMMMKSVVKLIANDKNINCQDGKYLSQMCGLIWASASPEEKSKFRQMAKEFERHHKSKFKHYKYIPPRRSVKNRGMIIEIKTPAYYQPGRQVSPLPHQMNEVTIQLDGMTILDHQASHQLGEMTILDHQASNQLDDKETAYADRRDSTFSQQLNETTFQLSENQASTFSHGVDEMRENGTMIINGISFHQQFEPTIAVNCTPLDPNARQAPIVINNHPLNPSSTFENRHMNMQHDNSKCSFFSKG